LGEKNYEFLVWHGLAFVLRSVDIFSSLGAISNYLYPRYPPDFNFSLASGLIGIILGICFMLIGVYVMKSGIKKNQNPQNT